MDLGIRGKVAMVAAGSRGLGRATALALAAEGCAVSICGMTPEHLDGVRGELETLGVKALAVRADVASSEDLDRWCDLTEAALGHVDILVTNTGGPAAAPFLELTDLQWAAGVESTLMNVVRLSRRLLPGMHARGWGRVVHLTSLVAKQPKGILTISSTLRAGISALTRVQATDAAPHGVTVNAVLPGHILTDRQIHLAQVASSRSGRSVEAHLEATAQEIPMGRIGSPEELGAAVAFLCSAKASYITGASLLVDGGLVQTSL